MTRPTVHELRARHPALVYESWTATPLPGALRLTFTLRLEPDLVFRPTLTVPMSDIPDPDTLAVWAFHLGMIETLSYWKAAVPPLVRVRAGSLSDDQVAWWLDLYRNGMGEFFFENAIDFTEPGFLRIEAEPAVGLGTPAVPLSPSGAAGAQGDLVLIGGGKDSAVTADLLEPRSGVGPRRAMVLNPLPAALRVAAIAGYEAPIVVERTIDPALLALNAAGYLNGHTPFSAVLAFVGSFVAATHGLRNVIVSNERGASAAQAVFHGQPINHQYSKSIRFEERFRAYAATYLTPDVSYFSFVRPLFDLQIAELFAARPAYHAGFRSCNLGQKTDSWCGHCAKCAFTYLSLGPFLDEPAIDAIFGRPILHEPAIAAHLQDLLGLGDHIPFDCVGTLDESRLALVLTVERRVRGGARVAPVLRALQAELAAAGLLPSSDHWAAMRASWGDDSGLPSRFRDLLRAALTPVPA